MISDANMPGRFRSISDSARILCLSLALLGLATVPAASADLAPSTFAELARSGIPAVVNISSRRTGAGPEPGTPPGLPDLPPGSPFEEFFRNFRDRETPPRPATAVGSGFVIDPQGYIATNHHVIEDADEISVVFHDGSTLPASVVGTDLATDLALIKVDPPKPLAAVAWGDSESVEVGDWLMAIGNPFGLGSTVTTGILSARSRDIEQGPYDEFLQTDAAINRGNSGGPLLDMQGRVIGINTAIFSPTGGSVGIGFAVPSSLARPVIEDLRRFGGVQRGWLGVQIQRVTPDIAESLGLEEPEGALVASVAPGGPAEKAGLRQGDVILSFDGQPIVQMRDLPRRVAQIDVGREVTIEILRDGRAQTIIATIAELSPPQVVAHSGGDETPGGSAPSAAGETLGLALAPLTPDLRRGFDIDGATTGVVVTGVGDGSPAGERGIEPGDVLVEVNRAAVATPEDVRSKVADARGDGRTSVLVLVNRRSALRYVPVPLDAQPDGAPSPGPG